MASSCYVASLRNQERLGFRPKQEQLWHHHVMSHLSVIRNRWDRDPKGGIVQSIIMLFRISVLSGTSGTETQTGESVASSCYVAYQRNQERLGLRHKQEELWHHHVMSHISVIRNGWD